MSLNLCQNRGLALRLVPVVVCLMIGLACSLDGPTAWLVDSDDTTVYASGYSDAGFRSVRRGHTEGEVQALLGSALEITWIFGESDENRVTVWFDANGTATGSLRPGTPEEPIARGDRAEAVRGRLGAPREIWWDYSKSSKDGSYRVRTIIFRSGRVAGKSSYYYVD